MARKAYRTRAANGQGSVRKKVITRKSGKNMKYGKLGILQDMMRMETKFKKQ